MNRCGIEDCELRAVTRGWCRKHYARWQRHGDPEKTLHPGGICAVSNCEARVWARRYCKNHYRNFMQYGDPVGGPGSGSIRQDEKRRFWAKVNKKGPSGCWLWKAGCSTTGYGNFWLDGTTVSAHRFAYKLLVGPIPERLHLDHLCRNRPCVNPAHLEPVTPKTNKARGKSPAAYNARKTHCAHGHLFAEVGVLYRGRRYCSMCQPSLRALLQKLE